jgi:hypothetical protein
MATGEEPARPDAVANDERLWRRVPRDRIDESREAPGRPAPRRQDAFRSKADEDGLSVDRARYYSDALTFLLSTEGTDEYWGVLEVLATCIRTEGFDVKPDPIGPDEPGGPNPAHALIVPRTNKRASRVITELANWAHEPPLPP